MEKVEKTKKKRSPMRKGDWVTLAGILVCIFSVLVGLYVTFYVCMYGGIVSIITGFSASPFAAGMIAGGVVRFLCAGLVGWITFFLGFGSGTTIIHVGEALNKKG